MSSNDIAVAVRGLSKSYTIAHNAAKHTMVGEAIAHRLKNPFHRAETETFWALKDIEFDIKKGDVVGIIGRNGAGKSTLLKILSQITEPTLGEVRLYGRVGSLLEVGTGFHPELTGRENIYLNGAILGMRKSEIDRQFDAIVDFAEVEQFLDTPVKRYSSGMYVRLAFAVAAHLNPEILVVDEVLAVGDAAFQKKCLGKMHDVSQQEGKTVLFVSHNKAAVSNLCSSAILLKRGEIAFKGETSVALDRYAEADLQNDENNSIESFRPSWATSWITAARLLDKKGKEQRVFDFHSDITVEIDFASPDNSRLRNPVMGVVISHATLGVVAGVNTRMTGFSVTDGPFKSGKLSCILQRLPLLQGLYSIEVWLGEGIENLDCLTGYLNFSVEASDIYGSGYTPFAHMGVMFLEPKWQISN